MLGKSTKILSPCRHGQQVSVSDSFDVGLVNKIEVAPKDAVIAQCEPEVSSLGSAYKLNWHWPKTADEDARVECCALC